MVAIATLARTDHVHGRFAFWLIEGSQDMDVSSSARGRGLVSDDACVITYCAYRRVPKKADAPDGVTELAARRCSATSASLLEGPL